MKQIMKLESSEGCFTILYDEKRDENRYILYQHRWMPNKYGVYGRHRTMIDRYATIGSALAEIMDAIRPLEEKLYWARQMEKGGTT